MFFFIAVFAFDPEKFCQHAVDNGKSYACGCDTPTEQYPLPCGKAQGERWVAGRLSPACGFD